MSKISKEYLLELLQKQNFKISTKEIIKFKSLSDVISIIECRTEQEICDDICSGSMNELECPSINRFICLLENDFDDEIKDMINELIYDVYWIIEFERIMRTDSVSEYILKYIYENGYLSINDLKMLFECNNILLASTLTFLYDDYINNTINPTFFSGFMNVTCETRNTELMDKYLKNVSSSVHLAYYNPDISMKYDTYCCQYKLKLIETLIDFHNLQIIDIQNFSSIFSAIYNHYLSTTNDELLHRVLQLIPKDKKICGNICNNKKEFDDLIRMLKIHNLKIAINYNTIAGIYSNENYHELHDIFADESIIIIGEPIDYWFGVNRLNLYRYLINNNLYYQNIEFKILITNIYSKKLMYKISTSDVELFTFIMEHTNLPDDVVNGEVDLIKYFKDD